MEVRDLWPQSLIDLGKLSKCNPIIKCLELLEKFLYRRASKFITLLPLAFKFINACGISSKKIVWIPNGVKLLRFEAVEPIRDESNGVFKVMYLRAHGLANALDVVIRAAKIVQDKGFSDIRFVLVGDGPEKSKLIAMANQLGLINVEFLDPVAKADIIGLLNKASAFY